MTKGAKEQSNGAKAVDAPSGSEPVAARTRPQRERKKVEVMNISKHTKPSLEHVEGDGTSLRDIEYVTYMFAKYKGADDLLKLVHRMIYGSDGQHTLRKKKLLDFKGIKGADDAATEQLLEAAKNRASRLTVAGMNETLDLFGLERGKGDEASKEAKIARIVDFLKSPEATGKKVPKAAQKNKRKSTDTGSGSRQAKRPRRSSKRSKKADSEDEESEEEESEEEEEEDEEVEEEEEAAMEEEEAPKPAKKKAAAPRKAKKAAEPPIEKEAKLEAEGMNAEKMAALVRELLRGAKAPREMTKRQLRKALQDSHGVSKAAVKEFDDLIMEECGKFLASLPKLDSNEAVAASDKADAGGEAAKDEAKPSAAAVAAAEEEKLEEEKSEQVAEAKVAVAPAEDGEGAVVTEAKATGDDAPLADAVQAKVDLKTDATFEEAPAAAAASKDAARAAPAKPAVADTVQETKAALEAEPEAAAAEKAGVEPTTDAAPAAEGVQVAPAEVAVAPAANGDGAVITEADTAGKDAALGGAVNTEVDLNTNKTFEAAPDAAA